MGHRLGQQRLLFCALSAAPLPPIAKPVVAALAVSTASVGGKYDYQAEMKERIDRAFRSYQSVMVQMPTSAEKSKRFILSENVEECDALYDLYYDGENPPIFKKRKKSYEL